MTPVDEWVVVMNALLWAKERRNLHFESLEARDIAVSVLGDYHREKRQAE